SPGRRALYGGGVEARGREEGPRGCARESGRERREPGRQRRRRHAAGAHGSLREAPRQSRRSGAGRRGGVAPGALPLRVSGAGALAAIVVTLSAALFAADAFAETFYYRW